MIIAIDFDNTIVRQDGREYQDVETDLEFLPGAYEALCSLKRAGHTLIIWTGRANRASRIDWRLNPLWASGKEVFHLPAWLKNQPLEEARYQHMLSFVADWLDGIIDAVDDGQQGKPSADIFIDDRAIALRGGTNDWDVIARTWGEPDEQDEREAVR